VTEDEAVALVRSHFPGSAIVPPADCRECLEGLSSEDLLHLSHVAAEREDRERRAREERIARAAELLHKPAIGFYRALRQDVVARS
jgi:hypothetical protein